MAQPTRINPYRELAVLRGRDLLLEQISHIANAQQASAADVLLYVLSFDDAHWDETERRANLHRPKGTDMVHACSANRAAVIDALRERDRLERRAARTDPDAAADAAGRE